MGESQPVDGHKWNVEANRFLTALGWKQLGDSRVDVVGKDNRTYGLDSVFYYEDPFHSGKNKGFFIEAKNYAWNNANPSELQKWSDDILQTLSQLPDSSDFLEKFSPPPNTRFVNGILMLWHHDDYRHETFAQRLSKIEIPRRRYPKNILVVSNSIILQLTAVLDQMKRIRAEEGVNEVEFFFPHRASERPIQSMNVPIEYFMSKYIFVSVKRIEKIRDATHPREDKLIFYFGDLDRASLDFTHKVANELQVANTPVIVYCSKNIHEHRSQIEDFRRAHEQYDVRQLTISLQIPEWITRES